MLCRAQLQQVKQSGAVEACWAHNPEVRRSKLRSANAKLFPSPHSDSELASENDLPTLCLQYLVCKPLSKEVKAPLPASATDYPHWLLATEFS